MGYYTTIKVVNKNGKAVKASISCGGTDRGMSDGTTGELSFDAYSNDTYDVYVKSSIHGKGSGKVKGGGEVTIRLK